MFTNLSSPWLRATLILVILGGIVISVNCEPEGPGGKTPIPITPSTVPITSSENVGEWQQLLDQGRYDQIIRETSPVVDAGEGAEFYAEARLYRGLAEIGQGGDLEAARADLDSAEKLLDQLRTVDKTQEQVLLFRGQIVVRAKLGDIEAAKSYRDRAIELVPAQQEAILREFESAIQ